MIRLMVAVFLAGMTATSAMAAPAPPPPVISGFGTTAEVVDPYLSPDPKLRYRVVFDISQAPKAADQVHQGLEKVARFVNLLGRYGNRPQAGDLVVVIHGQAAFVTLNAATFGKRFDGATNPNIEIIQKLTDAGVSIRLCGQSMAGLGFKPTELNPNIKVDVAAITTMATLQLQGFALIPQ